MEVLQDGHDRLFPSGFWRQDFSRKRFRMFMDLHLIRQAFFPVLHEAKFVWDASAVEGLIFEHEHQAFPQNDESISVEILIPFRTKKKNTIA